MRLIYLVTHQPGVMCGVEDYTDQLAKAVVQQGIEAKVEKLETWSFKELWRLREKYRRDDGVILHLQYPSLGMGKSPAPGLLPLLFPRGHVFITLHEFRQFSLIRKGYLLFFKLLTCGIIFTNQVENDIFSRFFAWGQRNYTLIPVGNNIEVAAYDKPVATREKRLVYFGQITKGKGLEDFLEAVGELRHQGNNIPCAIIGALMDAKSEISLKVDKEAGKLKIECLFNKSAEEVSRELSSSDVAFLPFPDGVSDKRGTALAVLKHGLGLVTRHSDQTPQWWRDVSYGVSDIKDAVLTIVQIAAGEKTKTPNPARLSEALHQREWGQIALKHIALYNAARSSAETAV